MPARKRKPNPLALALSATGLYGLIVDGDCMAPVVRDREAVACDPAASYGAGDLVVIYYRDHNGNSQAAIKRLSMGVMPGLKFPVRLHPDSDVMPMVMFESLSPQRGYALAGDKVLGIHKVIGKRTAEGGVDVRVVAENARHWSEAMKRRSDTRERAVGCATYREVPLGREDVA